jgi:hypothetical protein
MVVAWVALSPFFWWLNVSSAYDVRLPLSLLAQPILLGLVGMAFLPLLWRQHRLAAIVLQPLVLLVALSTLVYSTAFYGGTLVNAALLSVVSWVVWLKAPHRSHAASEA